MATQWSDHFATSQPGLALASPQPKVPWGVNNRHYKRASIIVDLAPDDFGIGDVARLVTVKSTDRISAMFLSSNGATAGAADIGLYAVGAAHDGAVADVNRFTAAKAFSGTVDRDECFSDATSNLVGTDRGKMVWELLGLSADSGVEYDIALTCTTAITVADANLVLELYGSFS